MSGKSSTWRYRSMLTLQVIAMEYCESTQCTGIFIKGVSDQYPLTFSRVSKRTVNNMNRAVTSMTTTTIEETQKYFVILLKGETRARHFWPKQSPLRSL